MRKERADEDEVELPFWFPAEVGRSTEALTPKLSTTKSSSRRSSSPTKISLFGKNVVRWRVTRPPPHGRSRMVFAYGLPASAIARTKISMADLPTPK
jgi:hypothetical protein